MDSSKVSLATNGEQFPSKPVKKDVPKRRIPAVPYVPPHRRNLSSTNCVKLARRLDLDYSDHSDLINKLPQAEKMIYSTNALLDDCSSDCSTTSTNLKMNITVHEKQSYKSYNENIEQTNFNDIKEKKSSVSQSPIDSDDHSGSESFEMYNTASDLTSESIICCNQKEIEGDIIVQTPSIEEGIFASNYSKADSPQNYQKLPVIENYKKTNSLSISVSNGARKVESIIEKCNEISNLSISTFNSIKNLSDNVEEKNNDLIIQKILALADVYVNLTFKTMLSDLYSKKYSEHIPPTILQEINFLVSVNNESSKTEDVTSTNKKRLSEHKTSIHVVNIEPKLLTSEDISGRFLVKIYNCKSITEIWGKIMNASNLQQLDKLLKEMKKFYDSEKLVASSIKEGGFYVVFKDNFWHRVKCLKCNETTAVVLFIDRGDESTFSLKDIFKLHEEFVLLPAQAIKMSLSDLDDFSDCYEAYIILKDKLHEKTVYATMLHYCDKNKCWNVKLYLNIYEDNINIADMVIEQLLKTFLNPKFNIQTEEMIQVHVSYVNENKIFIQLMKSKSYTYFMKLLRNCVKKYLDNRNLEHELNLNENKMYLVENPKNPKTWYRAKILKFKSKGAVEALLIDTGANICINKEDFILLEKFSSILTKYPEQAIEVQVHELSKFYEPETLGHYEKLISSGNSFFASFITKTVENNNIPTIRLFKKESDNSLTPINDKLLLHQESRSTSVNSLEKSESSDGIVSLQLQKMLKMRELQRSLSLTSLSTVLDPPQIPKDYCDVHVIFADNPSKFVVQLLLSKSVELKKLDCELSDTCNSYKGPRFTVESVKIGQLYAAKFDEYDYKWYRVYILEVITDTKSARVYYCDYGYYKEVEIENIVPLVTHFHQLPYQAVWAELYGIKPVLKRWTVNDALRFKDLTQHKNFACIVKNKKSFKPQSCQLLMPITVETVYSLELVDTRTEEDIYIADILVDEWRALKL